MLCLLLIGAGAIRAHGGEATGSAETGAAFAEAVENGSSAQIRVPREGTGASFLERARGLLGMAVLLVIAWLASVNRRKVMWRVVVWGLALQLMFAFLILRTGPGEQVFGLLNDVVVQLLGYTREGSSFLFGNLVKQTIPVGSGTVGNGGFTEIPGQVAQVGAQLAFDVLPTIVFFSSLVTMLYHIGIMQVFVRGVAFVMQRTMGTSGAETMSATANIFIGQVEAPLTVKPFVGRMTNSELMSVMTGGFATVAGGVLAAYVGMLFVYFPDVGGHLLAASVMSAPAALVVAKLMYPEDGEPVTAGTSPIGVERTDVNVIDAAARGASEGMRLALTVGAMLIAFVALIALVNGIVGWAGGLVGLEDLSLQRVLAWFLAPLAWLMGVPWQDAQEVGGLLGIKTVINEFVAYVQFAGTLGEGANLHPRSIVIATYALSGFANFASIAIQLGGIGDIAPERRGDLAKLGVRAMVGGTIAAFLTATIAGILL